MSSSNLRHIVIGDATHPDCELCKQVAAGSLKVDHFISPTMPPPMNRAERRALRKISQMVSRTPMARRGVPHPPSCSCRACESTQPA